MAVASPRSRSRLVGGLRLAHVSAEKDRGVLEAAACECLPGKKGGGVRN